MGLCNIILGEFDSSLNYFEKALESEENSINSYLKGQILYYLGLMRSEMGDYERGTKAFEKSLESNQKRGYYFNLTSTLNMFGNLYCEKGDLGLAETYSEQAEKMVKEQGNNFLIAFCFRTLGFLIKKN